MSVCGLLKILQVVFTNAVAIRLLSACVLCTNFCKLCYAILCLFVRRQSSLPLQFCKLCNRYICKNSQRLFCAAIAFLQLGRYAQMFFFDLFVFVCKTVEFRVSMLVPIVVSCCASLFWGQNLSMPPTQSLH